MNKIIYNILLVSALALTSQIAQARMFLATDRGSYLAGETVRCSAFTTDSDAVCYLELFGEGSSYKTSKIALESGRGGGSISLPVSIPTGNYSLVAYTSSGSADVRVISVYNTFSVERLKSVELVSTAPAVSELPSYSNGLSIKAEGGKVYISNNTSETVSSCLSISLSDGLSEGDVHTIRGFSGVAGSREDAKERDGEVIELKLSGPDAGKIVDDLSATAVLSFPGSKTDIYTTRLSSETDIKVPTENIFGSRDVACMIYGLPEGVDCHLEICPKHYRGAIPSPRPLVLCKSFADALSSRIGSMKETAQKADTLLYSLPLRRDHFFYPDECVTFVLDDYTRFPTMDELFVEILTCVRRRRGADRTKQIQVLLDDSKNSTVPKWGNALALIDGVPVFNHGKLWTYDPALIREVQIYQHNYSLGYRTYGGVVNFVTFKGNTPVMSFDDNVRMYDFVGCSYPEEFMGGTTLYWNPLLTLQSGETVAVDCSNAVKGGEYKVSAGGLTTSGTAVFSDVMVSF